MLLKIVLGVGLIISANMFHSYFHLPIYIELPVIGFATWAYAVACWIEHDEDYKEDKDEDDEDDDEDDKYNGKYDN